MDVWLMGLMKGRGCVVGGHGTEQAVAEGNG
jgi:Na+/glutamate symporter